MLEIIKFRRSSSEKITKTKCVLVASHSRDFLLLCVLEELSTHWLPQSAQHMNKHDEEKKAHGILHVLMPCARLLMKTCKNVFAIEALALSLILFRSELQSVHRLRFKH